MEHRRCLFNFLGRRERNFRQIELILHNGEILLQMLVTQDVKTPVLLKPRNRRIEIVTVPDVTRLLVAASNLLVIKSF